MSIDSDKVKLLLRSSDLAAIQQCLDDIAAAESSYSENSAAEQELVLKLQVMLHSRKLTVQQTEKASPEELAVTYRRVATLWMRSGESEKAIGQLQKALSLVGADATTLQLLARAQINLSKYDAAIETQEKAIEVIAPTSGENADPLARALVLLANIYEAKGEFEQAIAVLEKAAVLDALADMVQAEIQGKLGVICEKVGKEEQAVVALTKAYDLYSRQKGEAYYKTQEMAYLLEMASS
mmetsp:Transcript_8262/g.10822  ORF Transcript_8262/g.10822 Transcript_8262/m.10822 type:complete len:239 (+) Transcript_8262:84-800(+)|eukprot:CAMPEP_0198144936 /NCGR_PEP_ID=MMETSP1443-20131203/19763_1 /TAXON_ID=186043 /ORGANISM="Entomoneis sp., Strain CCMP2396" /LENGTH=238 /DNA_ID=CAMNT_0043808435 /DNA_START=19 /DNA_END=738 /DNA_ORIENTATION=+